MNIDPVIKQIFLFGREFDEGFREPFQLLFNQLLAYKVEIRIFSPLKEFILPWSSKACAGCCVFNTYDDLVGLEGVMFSIGGDGTFLEAVTLVRELPIPLAGINSGRLGFLADISQDEISAAVDSILQNRAIFDERALLQLDTENPLFDGFNYEILAEDGPGLEYTPCV